MSVFPSRTAGRPAVAPSVASPSAREAQGATPSPGRAERSRETPPEGGTGASGRVVLPAFRPSDEALAAYAALWHRLRQARERGEEVPCLGPGGEAWTSGRVVDQQTAADRCLDCVAMFLCKRYADLAEEPLGTWGGVTRTPALRTAPPRLGSSSVGQCACDCGGEPRGGRYLPGHDSRHLAQLVRLVRAGSLSADGARRALEGSPRLQAKLAGRLQG